MVPTTALVSVVLFLSLGAEAVPSNRKSWGRALATEGDVQARGLLNWWNTPSTGQQGAPAPAPAPSAPVAGQQPAGQQSAPVPAPASVSPSAPAKSAGPVPAPATPSAPATSTSAAAPAASTTQRAGGDYQTFNTGVGGVYAPPVTYSNGNWYTSNQQYWYLYDALVASCNTQANNCALSWNIANTGACWGSQVWACTSNAQTAANAYSSSAGVAASSSAAAWSQSSAAAYSSASAYSASANAYSASASAYSASSKAAAARPTSSAAPIKSMTPPVVAPSAPSPAKPPVASASSGSAGSSEPTTPRVVFGDMQTFTMSVGGFVAPPVTGSAYNWWMNGGYYYNLIDALTASCNFQQQLCDSNVWWSSFSSNDCDNIQAPACLSQAQTIVTNYNGQSGSAPSASASSVAPTANGASASAWSASQSAQAYSSSVAQYSAQQSAQAYSSSAAQYSAQQSAQAYSSSVSAAAAAQSASAYSASPAAYSAQQSAQAYSSSVSAAAAAQSASAYSASAAAYSAQQSAAAYSQSVSAAAAAQSAVAYSASAAAYSAQQSVAAYSQSVSAAAYSASQSAAAYSSSVSAAAAQATTVPSGWTMASTPCIAEGTTGRALISDSTSGPDMTWQVCTSYCGSKGYVLAGLEYSSECFCGTVLSNGASLNNPSSQCNMMASGNNQQIGGGPNAITLFVSSSIDMSKYTPDLSGMVETIPQGWTSATGSAGICVVEGTTGRALAAASTASDDMTNDKCIAFCAAGGFQFAGTEYSRECYCGNALVNGASLSNTASCNMQCSGAPGVTCGGPGLLTVWQNPSLAFVQTKVGAYSQQGCIQEVPGRALTGAFIDQPDMTVEKCTSYCQQGGFTFAGLEYASQCFCGNELVNGASLSSYSTQCNMQCAGNAQENCGGPDAIALYSTIAGLQNVGT